jgi:hypothetical protein
MGLGYTGGDQRTGGVGHEIFGSLYSVTQRYDNRQALDARGGNRGLTRASVRTVYGCGW